MPQEEIDLNALPEDVRVKLKQLEIELAEGDITQKGFDKKKLLLIGPYIQAQLNQDHRISSTPQTRAKRRNQRRLTREESRYKSEIRHESVQAALRQWNNCDNTESSNKSTEILNSPINLINKKKEDQQIYENSCIIINQESEEDKSLDLEKTIKNSTKDKIEDCDKTVDTFTLNKDITNSSSKEKEENNITDAIREEVENTSLKSSTSTVLQQLIVNSIADEMEPSGNNLINFLKSSGTFSSNTTNTTSSNDSCATTGRTQSKSNVYQNFNAKESNVDGESVSSINISELNISSCQEANNSYHTNESKNSNKSLDTENNPIPTKLPKVSVKIQALLESLQVS